MMAKPRKLKEDKEAIARVVHLAYASFHEYQVGAELALVHKVRALLAKDDVNTISTAIMTLVIKDHDTAIAFMRLCYHQACIRDEDRYPMQSTIMGWVVKQADSVKLSRKQICRLNGLAQESGIICPDSGIYFYPITVSMEKLITAHPCDIAGLHDLIQAQKRLPRHFTKHAEPAADIPPVQVLLMVITAPHRQVCRWELDPADDHRMAAFAMAASEIFPKGTAEVAAPRLLSDVVSSIMNDENMSSEVPDDKEAEFSEAILQLILDLGTSDLGADIEEPDDGSLEITLCNAEEDCRSLVMEYKAAGLSRPEAFMMVYDVLKSAGVLGIMLNEERDDENESDGDDMGGVGSFLPNNVVRH